jgi:hypothetical protein
MEYVKFNRSLWLVLLLGIFGACSDDDDNPQLAAPQLNDAADVSSTGFTISWSQVNNADGYLLDIATDEAFTEKVEGYDKKEIDGLTETLEDLEPATTYYFRVYATKGNQVSPASAVKSVTTDAAIAAPELNDAEDITTTGFTISWTEVEEAEGYLLDIATDEDFNNKVDGYDKKEIDGLTEMVEDLEPGTTYYVRVYAVQGELESLPSEVKEVTTEEE